MKLFKWHITKKDYKQLFDEEFKRRTNHENQAHDLGNKINEVLSHLRWTYIDKLCPKEVSEIFNILLRGTGKLWCVGEVWCTTKDTNK